MGKFWVGFWPDFVSSMITGLLISGLLTIIVGKILDDKKRKLEKNNLEKSFDYYQDNTKNWGERIKCNGK